MGRRISHAREALRWTQEELGERAGGYTRGAINRLEHGERLNPTAALIYGVARALGMTFEELWTGVRARPRADVQEVRDAIRTIERYLPGALGEHSLGISREPSGEPTRPPEDAGEAGGPPSGRSP